MAQNSAQNANLAQNADLTQNANLAQNSQSFIFGARHFIFASAGAQLNWKGKVRSDFPNLASMT